MKEQVKKTMKALTENGFEPFYFETPEEAMEALYQEISPEETVGIGGSVTIISMGVREKLEERGIRIITHNGEPDPKRRKTLMREAMITDVYLTSSNAITEDGKLVNIDGTGNRLASMLFGHDRVIYICGVNKLTKDVYEAYDRIKKIATPRNTERLQYDTPCRYGPCTDCRSPQRVCNGTLIMDKKMNSPRSLIYLINQELGY